jgi:hypothetical protein
MDGAGDNTGEALGSCGHLIRERELLPERPAWLGETAGLPSDLWDEVVPYPLWFCVLVQASVFLAIAAMIYGLCWTIMQIVGWLVG